MSNLDNLTPAQRRKEELRISKKINADLKKEKSQNATKSGDPRVLLLGSGDSGKTTFIKQLKILHGGGYDDDEKRSYLAHILDNVADSVVALVSAAGELSIAPAEKEVRAYMILLMDYFQSGHRVITPEIGDQIQKVWADGNIRAILPLPPKAKIQIQDTAGYFLSKITSFVPKDYIPTQEDILKARLPTTQISEIIFKINQMSIKFYDVGGQQKYRKQWIPYFDTVDMILFFVSLASYDQMLMEDVTVNRMHDALQLFGQIVNHGLLKHVPVTLFLNKMDLFEEKLVRSQVKTFFPDFQKENIFKHASRYFAAKFTAVKETSSEDEDNVHVHVTCCTDTQAMGVIITDVMDSILSKNLKSEGLM